jgi:hypothetical protein
MYFTVLGSLREAYEETSNNLYGCTSCCDSISYLDC